MNSRFKKTIKTDADNSRSMSQKIPEDLKDQLVRFVQTYSCIADLELDENLDPKRWFMPLESYAARKEAAHYFLFAASLSDYQLAGNPRNIRLLLHHLHEIFGQRIYTLTDPGVFKSGVLSYEQKMQVFDQLGQAKHEIPKVLCSINLFVLKKARGDLIEYADSLFQKGWKPKDFAKEMSYSVKRMNKHQKAKCWLYLSWMVRPSPDLRLFQFDPRDLIVALTTPKLRVAAALGLTSNEDMVFELNAKEMPENWWRDTAEFDADADRLNEFARSLFPDDPARVDFPFFILGTWLEYADLTPTFLMKSLRFLNQKHEELLQPLMRYLTVVSHYNRVGEVVPPGAFSGFEFDVYDFLKSKGVLFNYEFMEFCLPTENAGIDRFLTYKPDFLLPQFTDSGRKVILEPHGVGKNLKDVLFKLSVFRKHYGEFFCLILIVPDTFLQNIQNLDPSGNSYDYLWKQSDYKIQFEHFHKS